MDPVNQTSDKADDIPLEIQEEIITRVLPVKSLIRFRSVSKEWKSLIDSPEFITTHHHNSSMNNQAHHHLLIACKDNADSKVRYVSVVDDDISFPNHTFAPSVSPTVSMVIMLGCSHGLVCLVGLSRDRVNIVIVVWNPSIRKSFVIVLPFGTDEFGFGVCPRTSDPKIVMIPRNPIGYEATAEVFTLRSSGAWRSIPMNLPQELVIYTQTPVVIDGVIHWVAHDVFDTADDACSCRIIWFDLTSEEFERVDLPDCLIGLKSLGMSKLKQSLVVLDYYRASDDAVCDVWMMLKNGVPKSSFTKLFTLKEVTPNSIIGFRNNGLPIKHQRHGRYGELEAYEPGLEHKNGLGIYGWVFKMASYTESLLLLNHPAVSIFQ